MSTASSASAGRESKVQPNGGTDGQLAPGYVHRGDNLKNGVEIVGSSPLTTGCGDLTFHVDASLQLSSASNGPMASSQDSVRSAARAADLKLSAINSSLSASESRPAPSSAIAQHSENLSPRTRPGKDYSGANPSAFISEKSQFDEDHSFTNKYNWAGSTPNTDSLSYSAKGDLCSTDVCATSLEPSQLAQLVRSEMAVQQEEHEKRLQALRVQMEQELVERQAEIVKQLQHGGVAGPKSSTTESSPFKPRSLNSSGSLTSGPPLQTFKSAGTSTGGEVLGDRGACESSGGEDESREVDGVGSCPDNISISTSVSCTSSRVLQPGNLIPSQHSGGDCSRHGSNSVNSVSGYAAPGGLGDGGQGNGSPSDGGQADEHEGFSEDQRSIDSSVASGLERQRWQNGAGRESGSNGLAAGYLSNQSAANTGVSSAVSNGVAVTEEDNGGEVIDRGGAMIGGGRREGSWTDFGRQPADNIGENEQRDSSQALGGSNQVGSGVGRDSRNQRDEEPEGRHRYASGDLRSVHRPDGGSAHGDDVTTTGSSRNGDITTTGSSRNGSTSMSETHSGLGSMPSPRAAHGDGAGGEDTEEKDGRAATPVGVFDDDFPSAAILQSRSQSRPDSLSTVPSSASCQPCITRAPVSGQSSQSSLPSGARSDVSQSAAVGGHSEAMYGQSQGRVINTTHTDASPVGADELLKGPVLGFSPRGSTHSNVSKHSSAIEGSVRLEDAGGGRLTGVLGSGDGELLCESVHIPYEDKTAEGSVRGAGISSESVPLVGDGGGEGKKDELEERRWKAYRDALFGVGNGQAEKNSSGFGPFGGIEMASSRSLEDLISYRHESLGGVQHPLHPSKSAHSCSVESPLRSDYFPSPTKSEYTASQSLQSRLAAAHHQRAGQSLSPGGSAVAGGSTVRGSLSARPVYSSRSHVIRPVGTITSATSCDLGAATGNQCSGGVGSTSGVPGFRGSFQADFPGGSVAASHGGSVPAEVYPLGDLGDLSGRDSPTDTLSASARLSLRRKHARHLTDLRLYYEQEIGTLKAQLHSSSSNSTTPRNATDGAASNHGVPGAVPSAMLGGYPCTEMGGGDFEPNRAAVHRSVCGIGDDGSVLLAADREKLRRENVSLTSRCGTLESELTRAKRYICEVDSQMSRLEEVVSKSTDSSDKLRYAEMANSALQTEADLLKSEQTKSQEYIQQLRAKNQELYASLCDLYAEKSKTQELDQGKAKEAQNKFGTLYKTHSDTVDRFKSVEMKYFESVTEVEALRKAVERLELEQTRLGRENDILRHQASHNSFTSLNLSQSMESHMESPRVAPPFKPRPNEPHADLSSLSGGHYRTTARTTADSDQMRDRLQSHLDYTIYGSEERRPLSPLLKAERDYDQRKSREYQTSQHSNLASSDSRAHPSALAEHRKRAPIETSRRASSVRSSPPPRDNVWDTSPTRGITASTSHLKEAAPSSRKLLSNMPESQRSATYVSQLSEDSRKSSGQDSPACTLTAATSTSEPTLRTSTENSNVRKRSCSRDRTSLDGSGNTRVGSGLDVYNIAMAASPAAGPLVEAYNSAMMDVRNRHDSSGSGSQKRITVTPKRDASRLVSAPGERPYGYHHVGASPHKDPTSSIRSQWPAALIGATSEALSPRRGETSADTSRHVPTLSETSRHLSDTSRHVPTPSGASPVRSSDPVGVGRASVSPKVAKSTQTRPKLVSVSGRTSSPKKNLTKSFDAVHMASTSRSPKPKDVDATLSRVKNGQYVAAPPLLAPSSNPMPRPAKKQHRGANTTTRPGSASPPKSRRSAPSAPDRIVSPAGARPSTSASDFRAGVRGAGGGVGNANRLSERMKLVQDLGTRLDELLLEKRDKESVLSRIPTSSIGRKERGRQEVLEKELDKIDKDLGYVRQTLKTYNAL